MIKNYAEALKLMASGLHANASDRVMLLMGGGLRHVDAIIVNENYETTVSKILELIGAGIDELAEPLRANALLFAMHGVNVTLQQAEEILMEEIAEAHLAMGGNVRVMSPITPDCDCPACTIARAAMEQSESETRH